MYFVLSSLPALISLMLRLLASMHAVCLGIYIRISSHSSVFPSSPPYPAISQSLEPSQAPMPSIHLSVASSLSPLFLLYDRSALPSAPASSPPLLPQLFPAQSQSTVQRKRIILCAKRSLPRSASARHPPSASTCAARSHRCLADVCNPAVLHPPVPPGHAGRGGGDIGDDARELYRR